MREASTTDARSAPVSRRVVFWLGTAFGIALVVFLLLRYRLNAVFQPLLHSNAYLLVAAIALQAAIQILNAAAPAILLGPTEGGRLSFWSQARVFLAMQPLALFSPARLSDFAALPLLKRHHRPGTVASSIVLDRLITLFFLFLATPIALRLVWPGRVSTFGDAAAIAGLIAVASFPFLLANARTRRLANRYLLRRWPALLEGFGSHTNSLLHTSRGRLSLNLLLTALKTLLAGAAISVLAMNVGLSVSLLTAVSMSVLIQLATSIPIAPQGIGIAEGSLVLLFTINGFPGELALSIGVIARLLFVPVIVAVYMSTTLPLLAERLSGGHER